MFFYRPLNVPIAGLFLLRGISLRSDQSRGLVTGFKGCGGGELAVIDGSLVAQRQSEQSLTANVMQHQPGYWTAACSSSKN